MATDLVVPAVGESITEVQVGGWLKQVGDWVAKDEVLVEIESDKATVEVAAPAAGVLTQILKRTGEKAVVGEVIGQFDPQAGPAPSNSPPSAPPAASSAATATAAATAPPAAEAPARVMPSAQRILAESGLPPGAATPTGPGGRLLKEDAQRAAAAHTPSAPAGPPASTIPVPMTPAPALPAVRPAAPPPPAVPSPPVAPSVAPARVAPVPSAPAVATQRQPASPQPARTERIVPLSPIRQKIAERLVDAQQTAALLTTFNEVDLSAVQELRQQYKESFQQKYGVKLGFMSFFVKAAVDALRAIPQVNAQIRGEEIVYYDYCDIGIAVGGGKGLVVPVLRNAEQMSFSQIELAIAELAGRAQANKIKLEELQGGTFTISNGGVYGSLLSTPIVNPPQSGILGLHTIQDRPVARDGQVVIRPMMYLALTYDHRLVDGREAVTFLKRIKDCIELPTRLLLEV